MKASRFRLLCPCAILAAIVTWSDGNTVARAEPSNSPDNRPRVIATTDGEIDDRCSMVRFLLYANEWQIEGIIYSSSKFHWKGHNWAGTEWIQQQIDQYAKVYSNLKKHDPRYPSPDQLRKKVFVGNIENVGETSADTPGSERIVEVLLDEKPGPVYLQAWGGTNTIARALWKIQHSYPDKVEEVSRKAILYIILDQDNTLRDYIIPNWPQLQVLGSFRQFACIAYRWYDIIPPKYHRWFERPWMESNILHGHGPLCAIYEAKDGRFRSEGDSPSFMHQIDVGLRSLEHPSYGGWGGRFEPDPRFPGKNVWRGAADDGDIFKPIWRWAEAFQNDWAARADWCVKPPQQANHPPIPRVSGPLDIVAKPGQTVQLSAAGSTDPDGDKLFFRWWQYYDADSAASKVKIKTSDNGRMATFVVPNEPGKTIHVILEVTDSGDPPLTRYQRVIVTIAEK